MYICMWKGTDVFSLFGFRGGRINLPNNIIKWNSTENSLYSIMVRCNQFILWLQIPILGFVWGATNLNNVSNLGRRDFADLFGEQKKNFGILSELEINSIFIWINDSYAIFFVLLYIAIRIVEKIANHTLYPT